MLQFQSQALPAAETGNGRPHGSGQFGTFQWSRWAFLTFGEEILESATLIVLHQNPQALAGTAAARANGVAGHVLRDVKQPGGKFGLRCVALAMTIKPQ